MKVMPNVDVIFGNVTDMAIFAKTGSPTAGESAILSQAPPAGLGENDQLIPETQMITGMFSSRAVRQAPPPC